MSEIEAAILSDGRIQVWVIKPDFVGSQIQTRWKQTTDPGSAWSGWSEFPSPPSGGYPVAISAAPLEDKRLQLFLLDDKNQVWSAWKTSTNASSAWTPWSLFE